MLSCSFSICQMEEERRIAAKDASVAVAVVVVVVVVVAAATAAVSPSSQYLCLHFH